MFGRKKEEHHSYDALTDVLHTLDKCLNTPTEIRDKNIICTDWDIEISPKIDELTNQSAILNFNLSCPDWDEPLFECCAGTGGDQKTAVGSALGSFIFAFMHGIELMENNEESIPLESEFAGKTHCWKAYRSNIVGMGDNIEPDFDLYWNALKDGIVKRLGNQRMCYVKVYACKALGADGKENIVGECRVNDVPSDELGAIVYDIAAKFEITGFCSQKMFIFIRQDSRTLLPYPYRMNKLSALREKVTIALELFNKCETEEEYDALPNEMEQALGDATLAWECYAFLPEICAENAFKELKYSEQVKFSIDGSDAVTVYKNQLADFFTLGGLMFSIFDSGYFGEQTNDLYHKLILYSSIFSLVNQIRSDKRQLSDCALTALLFNTEAQFEIR